jgi:hypothetical protein
VSTRSTFRVIPQEQESDLSEAVAIGNYPSYPQLSSLPMRVFPSNLASPIEQDSLFSWINHRIF